jgi:GDPmannose 4,6-dehydratase
MLEAIREYDRMHPYGREIKFYQASSSEMFGKVVENPANRNNTILSKKSIWRMQNYMVIGLRKIIENHMSMFNVSGILFNHESVKEEA